MLQGHDIFYFSNDWRADNKTSSHHIAGQLKKHNRLFYIEASGMRAPSASAHDLRRIWKKASEFLKGPQQVEDNVYVFSPLILPFHKFGAVRKINEWLLAASLSGVCRKYKVNAPILWMVSPHMSTVIGKLKEKLVVYYCVDDFSSLPGVNEGSIRSFDRDLTQKADVVFTPSLPLYEKKRALNSHVHLAPHGVDLEHFRKVFDPGLAVPEDMKQIPRPIIGFFGLIEKWVDLELIKFIAEKRKNYSVVLIGRVVQDITMFAGLPNVFFLGSRPFKVLPEYAKLFDVATMPYVLNDQVFNANPIKLREYLAMGKPTVSVTNPEILQFADVVKIANGYDDFLNKIDEALRENTPELVARRVARVQDSSWEERFKKISSIVEDQLANKH